MNKVISDSYINSDLLKLIEDSEKYLVLVLPYLKLLGHLETQIENSVKRGVDFQLWYRSDKEKEYKKTYNKFSKMGVKVAKVTCLNLI
jgi:sugar-specific transcriptional regulator TrmB